MLLRYKLFQRNFFERVIVPFVQKCEILAYAALLSQHELQLPLNCIAPPLRNTMMEPNFARAHTNYATPAHLSNGIKRSSKCIVQLVTAVADDDVLAIVGKRRSRHVASRAVVALAEAARAFDGPRVHYGVRRWDGWRVVCDGESC